MEHPDIKNPLMLIEQPDAFSHKFDYDDDKSAEFVKWFNNIRTTYPFTRHERSATAFNYFKLVSRHRNPHQL